MIGDGPWTKGPSSSPTRELRHVKEEGKVPTRVWVVVS